MRRQGVQHSRQTKFRDCSIRFNREKKGTTEQGNSNGKGKVFCSHSILLPAAAALGNRFNLPEKTVYVFNDLRIGWELLPRLASYYKQQVVFVCGRLILPEQYLLSLVSETSRVVCLHVCRGGGFYDFVTKVFIRAKYCIMMWSN